MIEDNKKNALIALKKASSLTKKIIDMIEKDEYCMNVLQQIKSANGLLNSAFATTLENHLKTCGIKAFSSNNKSQQKKMIDEIMKAFNAAKK